MPKFTEDATEMVELKSPKSGQASQIIRRPVAPEVDPDLDTHMEKRRETSEVLANQSPAIARILIAIVVVILSIILVAVVSYTSGTSYKVAGGQSPRAIVLNIDKLSPVVVEFARNSNKAPYLNELITLGSAYSAVQAGYGSVKGTPPTSFIGAQSALFTGMSESVTGISTSSDLGAMVNHTTFLRAIKAASLDVTAIVPEYTMTKSTTTTDANGTSTTTCNNVGILDAECYELACPTGDAAFASCSTTDAFATCATSGSRVEDFIMSKTAQAMANGKELIYIQLDSYSNTAALDEDLRIGLTNLASLSEMYMVDALIGRIANLLASRTAAATENWLFIVTSEGMNAVLKAPLLVSVFATGAPVAVKPIADAIHNTTTEVGTVAVHAASTLDVLPTIAKWFDIALEYVSSGTFVGASQGLCYKGALMKNGCTTV